MKRFRRYRFLMAIALLLAAMAVLLARTMPHRPRAPRRPAPRVAVPAGPPSNRTAFREEPPVFYGPPSPPPPLYGPPSPPSRVPLLEILSPSSTAILPVPRAAIRSTNQPDQEALTACGWDTLGTRRGIPFYQPVEASVATAPPADGRRILFDRALPQSPPLAIVYCLDPSLDGGRGRYLSAVVDRVRQAAHSLGPTDSVGLVVAGNPVPTVVPLRATGDIAAFDRGLASLTAAKSASLASALQAAMEMAGASYVVVLTSAGCRFTNQDAAHLREELASRQLRPRLIAMLVGDGTPSDAARALRDLAVTTQGAFAWLKPSSPRQP